jgi:hypothetical protein
LKLKPFELRLKQEKLKNTSISTSLSFRDLGLYNTKRMESRCLWDSVIAFSRILVRSCLPSLSLLAARPTARPPARPPARAPACPPARPPARPPTCPPTCPPERPPARPPARLPARPPARPRARAPARPPARPPARAPARPRPAARQSERRFACLVFHKKQQFSRHVRTQETTLPSLIRLGSISLESKCPPARPPARPQQVRARAGAGARPRAWARARPRARPPARTRAPARLPARAPACAPARLPARPPTRKPASAPVRTYFELIWAEALCDKTVQNVKHDTASCILLLEAKNI